MILKIGSRQYAVATLAEASQRYQRARGTHASSRFPEGAVIDDSGAIVARVSYNGRVWPPGPWAKDVEPIMEAAEV